MRQQDPHPSSSPRWRTPALGRRTPTQSRRTPAQGRPMGRGAETEKLGDRSFDKLKLPFRIFPLNWFLRNKDLGGKPSSLPLFPPKIHREKPALGGERQHHHLGGGQHPAQHRPVYWAAPHGPRSLGSLAKSIYYVHFLDDP